MKRYLVFSMSFILLFMVFQVLFGVFLTFFYTPDLTSAWNQVEHLPSSVVIKGNSSLFPFLFAFLAATAAYFTPRIFMNNNSK